MDLHNDDMLFDPLPQPYRFINKILVRTIEDSIDLAEGGGTAEALNSFVAHNLRLTKVGKLPTKSVDNFFLSTSISENEIMLFTLIGDTNLIACGTSQGQILIYDNETQTVVFNLSVTTLSKFAVAHPIIQLCTFETDHSNFVLAFATEEMAFIVFLSNQYAIRTSIELDISSFSLDTLTFSQKSQPYLVVTDGLGRTAIYNCHTPAELVVQEGQAANAKAAASRPIALEPLLELEKCPISTGPVSAELAVPPKPDDSNNKKKPVKKKPAAAPKGRRAKSPGVTADNTQPIETTKYHAYVDVFDDIAVLRFGEFPVLQLYSLSTQSLIPVCEFPLPAAVTSSLELTDQNQLVLGMSNGSFCFLNIARRSLHDHLFPRQGAIVSLNYADGVLVTFSAQNCLNGYQLENCKVVKQLYCCSDQSILHTTAAGDYFITLNQRIADITVSTALNSTFAWDDRTFDLFPNVSILDIKTGEYIGTINTPTNLELVQLLWNKSEAILVFRDPVEYRSPTPTRSASPPHGRRNAPKPKATPPPAASKKGQAKKAATKKTEQETKEAPVEEFTIIRRQILVAFPLLENATGFVAAKGRMAEEKQRKMVQMKIRVESAKSSALTSHASIHASESCTSSLLVPDE